LDWVVFNKAQKQQKKVTNSGGYKKMQKIYMVMGESGEWDEHYRWNVRAFLNKEKAEAYAAKADKRAKEIHPIMMAAVREDRDIPDLENEYDPEMYLQCNGVSYFIVEVPFTE
jgi:hypothetical protein